MLDDWVKLDVRFFHHPKVVQCSAVAQLAAVAGIAYCGANRTDGFIPAAALGMLTTAKVTARHAAELVTVGLWEQVDGGWMVRGYLDAQRSREEAERRTRRESAGGTLGAHRRWHEKPGKADPACPHCDTPPHAVGEPVTHQVPHGVPHDTPIWGPNDRREEKRKPPTTSCTTTPTDATSTAAAAAAAAALEVIADTETAAEVQARAHTDNPIRNPHRYRARVLERLLADRLPEAETVANEHPDWTACQVADALTGSPARWAPNPECGTCGGSPWVIDPAGDARRCPTCGPDDSLLASVTTYA